MTVSGNPTAEVRVPLRGSGSAKTNHQGSKTIQNLHERIMDEKRFGFLVSSSRNGLAKWIMNGNRALLASVLSACYNSCVQEDLLSQDSTPFNQL